MANAVMSKAEGFTNPARLKIESGRGSNLKIKKRQSRSPAAVFLIKPPSVALEKFGEWVCVCRSSSAFFRRSSALWFRQHTTQKNNCRAAISLHLLPTLPPFAATKAVLTKKYRLYYIQKSTTCQLERNRY